MNGLVQDLRQALRQFRKSPGFFSVAVLTLAWVGIMAGWLAAFGVGRLAGDFIVGETPNDPVTYLSVSILLVLWRFSPATYPRTGQP